MKKKLILGVAIIFVLCIVVVLIVVKNSSSARKDNNITVDKKKEWSATEYIDGKEPSSNVTTTTKEVVTDPSSIVALVNKQYKVSADYKPDDLVEPQIAFSFNYNDEKRKLRKEAAENLELLFQGASYYGYELLGVSGYRSYERQKTLYEYNLIKYGYDYTQEYSAMPGTSEHQIGLAIDISCKSMKGLLRSSFGDTKEGKWVQDNAHKYGYIVRYPRNKTEVTGYGYEPWHIRYVGHDLAKYLHDNNMTLDEYYEYKLNRDLIDREQYAYYDDVLTKKKGNTIEFSEAVLDDILDESDVKDENNVSVEDKTEDKKPEDILNGLEVTSAPSKDSDEPEVKPTAEVTKPPTETSKPKQSPKPVVVPSRKPIADKPVESIAPSEDVSSDENEKEDTESESSKSEG